MQMYYSQWDQDKIVYDNFFKGKSDGIFVDIGAHDGITKSNSLFFERLGWTGICIEPIPEVYSKLIVNRKCTCINGCAYNRNGTVKFTRLHGYTEMLSGIDETYCEAHKNRINSEISHMGGGKETLEVACYKLEELLENANISHVDYLSVDTEGSEIQILMGIDFNKVTFGVLDIELNYKSDFEPISSFLMSKGYKYWGEIGGDIIFIPVK